MEFSHENHAGTRAVSIREMTVNDLPEILQIERASFANPWSKVHFLSSLYKKPVAQCWVAVSEERIVGFIIAWYIAGYSNDAGEIHIHNIAVKPDSRRLGIGRKLLKKAVGFGTDQDCELVSLEVRASNKPARYFYERHGFAMIGIRPDYYEDEDALVMEAETQTILTKFQEQE
ncbi:MAG: Ribosomal-protein-alanine acetyltransferase [Candidatus Marinimicrobia bacterium]|nr:Ribosomal-protein-alanine acetyltransferase [Candidatus Neomarinimicrobiota bacterium]